MTDAARIAGVTTAAILQRIKVGKLYSEFFNGRCRVVSLRSLQGYPVDVKEFARLKKQLCSVSEACELLGVTDAYVVRLVEKGHLEGFRLNGKAWALYRKSVTRNASDYTPGKKGQQRQPGRPARVKPPRLPPT